MPHPLVTQLRFTRSEFQRALAGLSDADARKRLLPMNCISWIIGHLAWQEQGCWLYYGQGRVLWPQLNASFGYAAPPSTPPLEEVWSAWNTVTSATDPWLDSLTTEQLQQDAHTPDWPGQRSWGSLLQRVIYHYWYHTGECLAIRQMLGHTPLPQFVGNIEVEAPYLPG